MTINSDAAKVLVDRWAQNNWGDRPERLGWDDAVRLVEYMINYESKPEIPYAKLESALTEKFLIRRRRGALGAGAIPDRGEVADVIAETLTCGPVSDDPNKLCPTCGAMPHERPGPKAEMLFMKLGTATDVVAAAKAWAAAGQSTGDRVKADRDLLAALNGLYIEESTTAMLRGSSPKAETVAIQVACPSCDFKFFLEGRDHARMIEMGIAAMWRGVNLSNMTRTQLARAVTDMGAALERAHLDHAGDLRVLAGGKR